MHRAVTSPVGPADDRRVFAVKPVAFAKWFADDRHSQAALRWLNRKDLLLVRDGARLPDGDIPVEAVVSFEKRIRKDGSRENGRWLRFLEPSAAAL